MKITTLLITGAWMLNQTVTAQSIRITEFQNGRISWQNSDTNRNYEYVVEWTPNLRETNWLQEWNSHRFSIGPGNLMTMPVPTFFKIHAFPVLEYISQTEMETAYSNAMVDAAVALPEEITSNLTPVTENNTNLIWRTNQGGVRQVKVASFMRYSTATNYYAIGDHVLAYGDQWVTVCPELGRFCSQYRGQDPVLRIKQVLGMPPTVANDTVVEFWVSPDYLFRPTPDPEINDCSAGLVNSSESPLMSASPRYNSFFVEWFNTTYATRGYGMTNGIFSGYPWTRLGYTYDWATTLPPHFGLSEYVIPSGMLSSKSGIVVPIEVISITSATTYGKN